MRFLLVEFVLLAPCIAAVLPAAVAGPAGGFETACCDKRR
jgi:hypothetical protein